MAREIAAGACYVDTSALVKRYLEERGSEAFDDFCAVAQSDLVVCPLGTTEFTGMLQRRIRIGELTARQAASVRQRFLTDLSAGGWTLIPFGADVFAKASELMTSLGAPLSTVDGLHLACALQHGADHFATADLQLATAARKAGLNVHTF